MSLLSKVFKILRATCYYGQFWDEIYAVLDIINDTDCEYFLFLLLKFLCHQFIFTT